MNPTQIFFYQCHRILVETGVPGSPGDSLSVPATSRQGVSALSQVGVKAWWYRVKVHRCLPQSGSLKSLPAASPCREVRSGDRPGQSSQGAQGPVGGWSFIAGRAPPALPS